MTSEQELSILRRAFARQIAFASHADDPRLEAAFAELRRETFLGPGPWPVPDFPSGYRLTPDADPLWLYQNVVVGMKTDEEQRRGDAFPARFAAPTMIYPCVGMRDPVAEAELAKAFRDGGTEKVRRLVRTDDVAPETCWVRAPGWALVFE